MRAALAVLMFAFCSVNAHADGNRVYNRACAACHMAEGRGAPNVAPPLREQAACFARQPEGRAYLAGVLKHGLEGSITVEGALFDDYMPAATQLSSSEKAAVLNYLVALGTRCAGQPAPFTAAEIDGALNEEKWNSSTIRTLREPLPPEPAAPGNAQEPAVPSADAARVQPKRAARMAQAAEDFTVHCRGCHTPAGEAVSGRVPALKENVGLFPHTAEGRAFLVQVPGVAFAPLGDQRLADLLNWLIESLGAEQAPAPFTPYSASEVGAYRQQVLLDVDAARRRVVAQLQREGFQAPR